MILALGFLLGAAIAAVAYWLGYHRGRRANWASGERIIQHLLDEIDVYEAAEQEWLREHHLTDDDREMLARMH